ncbi:MAG: type I site-specific deoxyribonuclease specificity subunit [Candidatus Kapaibacterium sp.]|nr:MAG: type I site-specific deoxyribonuclease specificity subunit [Candidatus Kapabacteria bacterium]
MPEQKKAVTPRLRFPEFRNAGPWKVKRLGEILREVRKERIESDAYEVVNVKLHAKGLERTGRKPLINSKGRPYYVVREGEILIGKQNFHNGSIALVTNEYDGFVASNAIFHLDTLRYDDKRFLVAYLARPSFYMQISDLIGGTGQKEISNQLLFALHVSIPTLPEQQKIADCLSSLDELIELEAKRLEALKAHKKGLMQQLFPREGETTPRLRFPEFRNAGPWEVKRLGEVAEIITERVADRECTLLSVSAGVGLIPQIEKFGREIAGRQRSNYFVVRKYDFAYNKSATKEYPQGYVGLYEGDELAAVPNSIFVCFRPNLEKIVPRYLMFLFEANVHGKWLSRFIAVGARAHGSLNIDNQDLLNTPIPLPPSTQDSGEQQKIADCLSSLDELIELEAKQLEALQTHKKGLMQQLFPQEIDL